MRSGSVANITGKEQKGEGMGLMMQKIKAAHHPEDFSIADPTPKASGEKKLGLNF
jgi:hypothetical protein